jgi:hypothetical protein
MTYKKTSDDNAMTTNEVFHHIVLLLQLHKDRDYLIELFKKGGMVVTNSKIKGWRNKNPESPDYRIMPRHVLEKLLMALHNEKLISIDEGI